eukprot:11881392-Karenia_brevis.AAC.1
MKVQELYGVIAHLKEAGRQQGCRTILGRDFNAEVGLPGEEEDSKIIGKFGFDRANSRGQLLKAW